MGPELRLCGYPGGISGNTAELFLRPPPANFGAKVSCRQLLQGYKHFTLLEPGVGYSSLVQDNYFILRMPVHKMQV